MRRGMGTPTVEKKPRGRAPGLHYDMRSIGLLLGFFGRRGGFGGFAGGDVFAALGTAGFPGFEATEVALGEEILDGLGGLGTDGEPVLHTLFVDVEGFGGVGLAGVEPPEVFEAGAVTPDSAVNGGEAVERAVVTAGTLETKSNHWRLR